MTISLSILDNKYMLIVDTFLAKEHTLGTVKICEGRKNPLKSFLYNYIMENNYYNIFTFREI